MSAFARIDVPETGNGSIAEQVLTSLAVSDKLLKLPVNGRPGYRDVLFLQMVRDLRRRQKYILYRSKVRKDGFALLCAVVFRSLQAATPPYEIVTLSHFTRKK